ncbi:MAG: hypothetical protein VW080_03960 [Flavobacteriaceae bacterium]
MKLILNPTLILLILVLMISSCDQSKGLLLSQKERIALADKKFEKIEDLLQGSPEAMILLEDVIALNPNHCEAIRELSIPYLKRGIPHKWKPIMDRAVACDPKTWQGWRGYLYLYFYRDYKKAIADFDATDSLTPNYIDAPQGHSVDFWRGHAYFGLKEYEQSIYYYKKHIAKVTEDFGEEWIEINAFLYLGIVLFETGKLEESLEYIDKALLYAENKSAEAHYYKAKILMKLGQKERALIHINQSLKDLKAKYYNRRNYVESIRQIYVEEIKEFKKVLENPKP